MGNCGFKSHRQEVAIGRKCGLESGFPEALSSEPNLHRYYTVSVFQEISYTMLGRDNVTLKVFNDFEFGGIGHPK